MNFVNTHNARLSESIYEPFQLSDEEQDYLCQDILNQLDLQDADRIRIQTLEH